MRKLLLAGLAALVSLGAVSAYPETLTFVPGEAKNVWIQVDERDAAAFTIQSCDYWVKDQTNGYEWPPSPNTQTAATIIGNRFYGFVPSTTGYLGRTDWTSGSEYRVYFKWSTAEQPKEIHLDIVKVTCGEEYL